MFQERTSRIGREPGEEVEDAMAVLFGRFLDRHQAGHDPRAFQAAMAERELAENHQLPEQLLGAIVRGGHPGIVQKAEPLGAVSAQPTLQPAGLVMVNRIRGLEPLLFLPQPVDLQSQFPAAVRPLTPVATDPIGV
jgi:hypothetical protein